MTPNPTIILYGGSKLSGHSHRAELMLRLLGLPYEYRTINLAKGEHKTPAFLALNPFATVPVNERKELFYTKLSDRRARCGTP